MKNKQAEDLMSISIYILEYIYIYIYTHVSRNKILLLGLYAHQGFNSNRFKDLIVEHQVCWNIKCWLAYALTV